MRQYLRCSENEWCLQTCEYVLCGIGTGMEHPGLPGLAIIVRTGYAPNSKLLLAPDPADHCFFGSVYQVP